MVSLEALGANVGCKEGRAALCDSGMHDRLQPCECVRIAENSPAEFDAVDAVGPGRTGERRFDGRKHDAVRPLHRAHFGIGIEYRHAERFEHPGDG